MKSIGVRVALFSAYFLFAILLNSVGTVILQAIATLEVTKSDASVLEAYKDLPIALVSFALASLLPRVGYRRAMILAFAIVAVACIAMPLAPSFLTAKLLFLATGASFALIKVVVYSTIGLLAKNENHHASLLNTIEGFFMIGVLSGYWVFAAFIQPNAPASLGWLNVYWLLAAVAAGNVVMLMFVDFPRAAIAAGAGFVGEIGEMLRLLWRPAVIVFVIAAFLYVLIEQGIGTWLPTFNNEVLHLPQAMSVQAASIFAAALAIGRLSAGFVLQRLNWFWLLNICVASMAVLIMLTLPLARGLQADSGMTWLSAPPAAFLLPMIGLFMAPIYPAINSVILSSLPKERHAAMTGLIVVFSALGGTTGSFITGQTFARVGGETAFYLTLGPMAAIALALFLLRRVVGGAPGQVANHATSEA